MTSSLISLGATYDDGADVVWDFQQCPHLICAYTASVDRDTRDLHTVALTEALQASGDTVRINPSPEALADLVHLAGQRLRQLEAGSRLSHDPIVVLITHRHADVSARLLGDLARIGGSAGVHLCLVGDAKFYFPPHLSGEARDNITGRFVLGSASDVDWHVLFGSAETVVVSRGDGVVVDLGEGLRRATACIGRSGAA